MPISGYKREKRSNLGQLERRDDHQAATPSPLAIICIPTMPLEPGGPLEGMAVPMLGIMRPGATVWPIIGPTPPPMGPCGPQPCCMGPRMEPLPIMSGPKRIQTVRNRGNYCVKRTTINDLLIWQPHFQDFDFVKEKNCFLQTC